MDKKPIRAKERIGQRFGRLTINSVNRNEKGKNIAECVCDCGQTKACLVSYLVSGSTKSCGCLRKEATKNMGLSNTTHGMSDTHNMYRIWSGMKTRCNTKTAKDYYRYGARGIKVCDRWLNSFENFVEDMAPRPDGLSLDRIDNTKGYSKENCRWATGKEQCRNTSTNVLLEMHGKIKTLSEWVELHPPIRFDTAWRRLKRGWTVEDTFKKPIGPSRRVYKRKGKINEL